MFMLLLNHLRVALNLCLFKLLLVIADLGHPESNLFDVLSALCDGCVIDVRASNDVLVGGSAHEVFTEVGCCCC